MTEETEGTTLQYGYYIPVPAFEIYVLAKLNPILPTFH
jgi:hypothetical protein